LREKNEKIELFFKKSFKTMIKFMAYFIFWAILSLTSSGMIAIISGGILFIVAVVLINIPIFLFIYCSYKMAKPLNEEEFSETEILVKI